MNAEDLCRSQGLTLATLCDMVLGENAADRSDSALIAGVRRLLNKKDRVVERCPSCLWALTPEGDCRGPQWCPHHGSRVENPMFISDSEACARIGHACAGCGNPIPCGGCK